MNQDRHSERWSLAGVLLNRDARWVMPHLWRFGCLVLVWLSFATATAGVTRSAAPGLMVLYNLTFASAAGLLAWAVFGVGTVFRDEWLGNNLDLVQLTGISAFDLLLAKLIPTWLTALSVLLLEIPCLQLCVTLGGVTPIQVWAVTWQLLWMFIVASAITAMLASLLKSPRAIAGSAAVIFGLYCIASSILVDLPSKVFAILVLGQSPDVNNETSAACFPVEFAYIFRSGFSGPVLNWQTLVHLAFVAAALWLASRSVQTRLASPRDVPDVEETAPEGEVHKSTMPVWRPSYALPPITGNAIEWKDYHFTLGGDEMLAGKWIIVGLALMIIFPIAVPVLLGGEIDQFVLAPIVFVVALIAAMGVLATLAFSAQRLWQQELRERTLGQLALLPISAEDLIRAKLRVLFRISQPEIVLSGICLMLNVAWSIEWRFWHFCQLNVALLLSIPMVVCTDAAWRFLPQTWAGFRPRTELASMNLAAWSLSGIIAFAGSPLLGLIVLGGLVIPICRASLKIGAESLAKHAGELEA